MSQLRIKSGLRRPFQAYFYRTENGLSDEFVFYDTITYHFRDYSQFSAHCRSLQSLMNKNSVSRVLVCPDFRGHVILEKDSLLNSDSQQKIPF